MELSMKLIRLAVVALTLTAAACSDTSITPVAASHVTSFNVDSTVESETCKAGGYIGGNGRCE